MNVRWAVCLALVLSGCGLSDHYASLPIPAFLRYGSPPSSLQEYPDLVTLAKAHGRNLFGTRPDAIEISTPLYSAATNTYAACARAPNHPEMFAIIGRDGFQERRRSVPEDGCIGLEYTEIKVD